MKLTKQQRALLKLVCAGYSQTVCDLIGVDHPMVAWFNYETNWRLDDSRAYRTAEWANKIMAMDEGEIK